MTCLTVPTQFGPLTLYEEEGAVVRLVWDGDGRDDTPLLREAAAQLRAYDAGTLEVFDVPLRNVEDWHAQAFIMLDRDRFTANGLIPAELPDFPYGFQFGDRMWVSEQPSGYYRRHLLLHEGTH